MLPIVDIASRDQRYPGQIPDREAIKLTNTKPKEWNIDRFFDKPVLMASGVVQGLGLPINEVSQWIGVINHALFSAENELDFRKEIMIYSQQLDPIVRNIIGMRAMQYYRYMKKGFNYVVDLKKAEARGGNYYRRVPKANGKGYNYFYDEEQYHQSKHGHETGDRAQSNYLTNKVKVILTTNKGGDISAFKGLVKKYGLEKTASVLDTCKSGGNLKIKNKKFYWVGKEENEQK